jgi:hypothetical protein
LHIENWIQIIVGYLWRELEGGVTTMSSIDEYYNLKKRAKARGPLIQLVGDEHFPFKLEFKGVIY